MDPQDEKPTGRRKFLKSVAFFAGAAGAAGLESAAAAVSAKAAPASAERGRATLAYPEKTIGSHSQLRPGATLPFFYPDPASPCLLIKTGKECAHGVGPDKDLLAFSLLCSHQGCAVAYDGADGTFRCPCHFSKFDAEKSGQVVCGQAIRGLPRIELAWDEKKDRIVALGVDGLIYGRQANII